MARFKLVSPIAPSGVLYTRKTTKATIFADMAGKSSIRVWLTQDGQYGSQTLFQSFLPDVRVLISDPAKQGAWSECSAGMMAAYWTGVGDAPLPESGYCYRVAYDTSGSPSEYAWFVRIYLGGLTYSGGGWTDFSGADLDRERKVCVHAIGYGV